jgi:hypothetical protein
MLLGNLTLLYYLHVVLHAPVIAWPIPFSIASLLFAVGVPDSSSELARAALLAARKRAQGNASAHGILHRGSPQPGSRIHIW